VVKIGGPPKKEGARKGGLPFFQKEGDHPQIYPPRGRTPLEKIKRGGEKEKKDFLTPPTLKKRAPKLGYQR